MIAAAAYHGLLEPGSLESGKVEALAFLLLSNRIRPEAYETFRYFRDQGVTVKVISGDHPRTVAEIAARVGYDSQSKFSSAFKAFSGMLPTEYRKSRRPEVSQSGNNNEMRL